MDWKDAKFYVDNQLDNPYGNDKKQLCKRLTVSSNATIYQMMDCTKMELVSISAYARYDQCLQFETSNNQLDWMPDMSLSINNSKAWLPHSQVPLTFLSLAVWNFHTGSDEKLGRGLG